MSGFRSDFFRIISDGDKIIFLRDSDKGRECYLYSNPLLTSLTMNMNKPCFEIQSYDGYKEYMPGLAEYNVELSFRGGECRMIDKPLVMGVDIFDKLSITDYLDIINEKIKTRRY
jgi:hypothetical protein